MKQERLLLVVGLMVALAVIIFVALDVRIPGIKQQPTACTMEAKICPDGSAVGRSGPNCEFATCNP